MPDLSATQRTNLTVVENWARYFNAGDVARMIAECYQPGAEMRVMGFGAVNDAEAFLAFEQAVSKAAPRRYITIKATYPCDDVVVVEALLFDPDKGDDWSLPWCTFLSFEDGRITRDRNYLDFSRWPSSEAIG